MSMYVCMYGVHCMYVLYNTDSCNHMHVGAGAGETGRDKFSHSWGQLVQVHSINDKNYKLSLLPYSFSFLQEFLFNAYSFLSLSFLRLTLFPPSVSLP